MSLDQSIPELDRKGLREFAFILGGAVAAIFGLFLPWVFERSFPLWPWIFLAMFAAWGLLLPMTLRPVYRIWMRFGLLMNRITTPLILGVVFFIIIAPVGLFRRLLGKDSIAKGAQADKQTYRVNSDEIPKESLERPF
jgi:predicted membrane metal-binding protein